MSKKKDRNSGAQGNDLLEPVMSALAGEDIGAEGAEYSSHKDQLLAAVPSPERISTLESSLLKAYGSAIIYQEVPFVQFSEMTAAELAKAFLDCPIIIKPTLACVNVAQRAIKRDLGIDFDTYSERITPEQASLIAGYTKPLLPPVIAIPALMELDRFFWTDKEMRARKGNWERTVTEAINAVAGCVYKKCKFVCDGEDFEIDAAYPQTGDIEVGIDVKRIESARDTHKRADEIINKATKFKKTFPNGKFYVVVYYPFPSQHINLQSRLKSDHIDEVFFAAETPSSIANAVDMLVGVVGSKKK